jgi:hypothetical protein
VITEADSAAYSVLRDPHETGMRAARAR